MSDRYVIMSCTVCRKVRDGRWDGVEEEEWCSLADFLHRRHASSEDVSLSESYCPDCALSYDRLVQYGQPRLDPSR